MTNDIEKNEFKQEVFQLVMAITSVIAILVFWSLLENIHI